MSDVLLHPSIATASKQSGSDGSGRHSSAGPHNTRRKRWGRKPHASTVALRHGAKTVAATTAHAGYVIGATLLGTAAVAVAVPVFIIGGTVFAVYVAGRAVASAAGRDPRTAEERRRKRELQRLDASSHLERLDDESQELEEIRRLVARRAAATEAHYGHRLQVVCAYRVQNRDLEEAYSARVGEIETPRGILGSALHHLVGGSPRNVRHLFHGTSAANVLAIVRDGFRLPPKHGMFGKGIYFAKSPLKSWQYARQSRMILLCDVALGRTLRQRTARSQLHAESPELTKGDWIDARGFDSVTAPGGSVVRVAEFCIYDRLLALPRYVIVCQPAHDKA
mmetsp:Transcript_17201/g.49907  ORF Transcript_17201/g.49907 Transcript_17201/m.49907 type:complete len:337 (-) Transcript_17201:177-1187(-)